VNLSIDCVENSIGMKQTEPVMMHVEGIDLSLSGAASTAAFAIRFLVSQFPFIEVNGKVLLNEGCYVRFISLYNLFPFKSCLMEGCLTLSQLLPQMLIGLFKLNQSILHL